MTANEFILLELGIGSCDDMLDRICDGFNVELTDYDIGTAIENNIDCLSNVGNDLIYRLYKAVIEKGVEEYGLSKDKFTYALNSMASRLFYDGESVSDADDLQRISNEEHEKRIIEYLEEKDVKVTKCDNGWELENFTNKGGDQIIYLDELSKDELVEYLENFDVNEETLIHCQDHSNIPFNNVGVLYNDIAEWCDDMLEIAYNIPD